MNICGLNFYKEDKGARVEKQLRLIKSIFEINKKNNFHIIKDFNRQIKLSELSFFVTCGDKKITFSKEMINKFNQLHSYNKPRLIRDVTYLRIIPKIKKVDVNNFPRFTWDNILPYRLNFPFDKSYDRWLDLKKTYNLKIEDYKKQGDNILFLLQIPTDASLNELNFKKGGYLNFLVKTIIEVFKYSDRKIILRSHPLNKKDDTLSKFLLKYFHKTNKVFLSKNEKLEDDFNNIKCVISYNSSATVEALFNGINVINLSKMQPCFTAASNKLSDIEDLKELNRENFLKKIAFLHWENEELESNNVKKYLCNLLENSIPNPE